MSDKITVLCVKKTGHVLASLTRAADAEAEVKAEDLAGKDGLLVRGVADPPDPDAIFFFPVEELEAKVVDYKQGLVENPRKFYLDENGEAQPLDPSGSVSSVSITGPPAQITVAVGGAAVAATAAVLVVVTDQDLQRYQRFSGEKAATATSIVFDGNALGPGAHYALALVAGYAPRAEEL